MKSVNILTVLIWLLGGALAVAALFATQQPIAPAVILVVTAVASRSPQLADHLRREVGEQWWRTPETGQRLRALFAEGTRPLSEDVAVRLGYDPLDTGPLVAELSR